MSLFDYKARTLNGEEKPLSDYKGKVLLVVNTASKCGFTPQYEGLQKLYANFADRGLEVLGFPCNQFGRQEPGEAEEKVDVNGDNAHPVFKFLKSESPGLLGTEAIKWNFTKFLVDRDGNVVKRYAPKDKPEKLADDIEALL